jgi:hypothetical protein
MRRLTALSIYDSVPLLTPSEMPDNNYWKRFKSSNQSIVCMSDMTVRPMIHFIDKFLKVHKISDDDYDFLMNYTTQREPGDASINGVSVIDANIKCSNGFVHQMAEVVTPLQNMAEIIRTKPTTTQYNRFLERFCAPYGNIDITKEYNRIYKVNIDTVYQKRFFSQRSQGGAVLDYSPDKRAVNGMLKFDPAWNSYFTSTSVSISNDRALQQDMAVMLVPSDAAFNDYWENGIGRV